MSSISCVLCNVAHEKLTVLANLLNTFLPHARIPNIDHLQAIFVTADASKEAVVNNLLSMGNRQGKYIAGTQSNACAVAVETDSALTCYIVLNESFVQQINPQHPNASEIAIPLLEELLHIRHYSTLWQKQGYIYPRFGDSFASDLFTACFGFYDEYIVNRWKYTLLITEFHIENAGETVLLSASDFPLVSYLDQAQNKLFSIISDAASNKISKQDAWLSIMQCVYRNIFELLARYAAPIAAIDPGQFETFIDLSQHKFYQQYVAAYWKQIQAELEHAFDNDLAEARKTLDNIMKLLRSFLTNIGVSYQITARGDCHIDFVVK